MGNFIALTDEDLPTQSPLILAIAISSQGNSQLTLAFEPSLFSQHLSLLSASGGLPNR